MTDRSELYGYQVDAIRHGFELGGRTGILAPPGSGKTRISIEILDKLDAYDVGRGSVLILCPGSVVATWITEHQKWAGLGDEDVFVVRGSPSERARLWKQREGVFITNYAVLRQDASTILAKTWSAVICDEYHKVLLRHKRGKKKTQRADGTMSVTTHEVVHSLGLRCHRQLWVSGSFLRRDPSSLWTLFHMINRKTWSSYWRWVNQYCVTEENMYTRNAIVGPKNTRELRGLLDEHCVYIPEAVVASQLPHGNRKRQYVEMSATQRKMYDLVENEMILELESGDIHVTPTVLSQIVTMRKLLCSPRLVDPSLQDLGGGIEYILDQIDPQNEDTWHFAVFVPFRDGCDVVAEALTRAMPRHFEGAVEILRGGLDADSHAKILHNFRTYRGPIVCTIQYAEGFDMETCKQSYFLGYDYSLDVNQQAEGRTRRAVSQHRLVNWQYLCYRYTIDETFLAKLNQDQMNVNRVLKSPVELLGALRGQ